MIQGWGRFLEKETATYSRAFLIAQLVKNPPPMQETLVRFLCWEDPLEKGSATHSSILGLPCGSASKESACNIGDLGSIPGLGRSLEKGKATLFSILAWRIPWTVESMGLQRVGRDRVTFTSLVLLPGKFHGQRILVGYGSWGPKESNPT